MLRYHLTYCLPDSVVAVYDDHSRLLLVNALWLSPVQFRELVADHESAQSAAHGAPDHRRR